jgi:FtsZ-binding cell division protein ZapB
MLGLSGALLACGCVTSSGGSTSGVGAVGPALSARPPGGFGPVGQGGPTPPGPSGGPPGPVNLAGYNQLAEYQASDLSSKVAELQDENKSLSARLQGLQGLLEERERAVLAARGEVQSASQEVTRARQEITRCRQEIASLREHIRAADKESQASLQSLVNVLETMLGDAPPPRPASKETDTKPSK